LANQRKRLSPRLLAGGLFTFEDEIADVGPPALPMSVSPRAILSPDHTAENAEFDQAQSGDMTVLFLEGP
jgi:hypothetical protein